MKHLWQPGQSGNPAGRQKGEDHYTRAAVIRDCKARSFHPILAMIDLYEDPKSTNYLKFEVCKEIAAYVYPKVKHVQLTDADGENASITIRWDNKPQVNVSNVEDRLIDAIVEDDDDVP